jgi:MoaD family protein
MGPVAVHLKYLSALRQKTGVRREEVGFPEGSVLEDVVRWLRDKYEIDCLDRRLMLIVNGKGWKQYPGKLQTALNPGDSILLMPPVSGG